MPSMTSFLCKNKHFIEYKINRKSKNKTRTENNGSKLLQNICVKNAQNIEANKITRVVYREITNAQVDTNS